MVVSGIALIWSSTLQKLYPWPIGQGHRFLLGSITVDGQDGTG
jgi:hypothetical protein